MERRLAAVLISDVVGYTKLMEEDTEGTVAAWSHARDKVIDPTVSSSDELDNLNYQILLVSERSSYRL